MKLKYEGEFEPRTKEISVFICCNSSTDVVRADIPPVLISAHAKDRRSTFRVVGVLSLLRLRFECRCLLRFRGGLGFLFLSFFASSPPDPRQLLDQVNSGANQTQRSPVSEMEVVFRRCPERT